MTRRLFELYANGRYNLHALKDEAQKSGLRNRRGGMVSINGLSTILRNPFYIGLIRVSRRKETYEGAHEPLVTKSLFDRVQAVLDGKLTARPEKHDFVFRRRLRCAGCGYSLIGERQKGHTYYRCHTCSGTSVREEVPEGKLRPFLQLLQRTDEERAYVREKIEALRANWQNESTNQRKTLELQLSQLSTRRTRLADALLDGLLDRDLFEERKEALLAEKRAIEDRLTSLDRDGDAGLQRLKDFLERLDSAYSQYEFGTPDEKRALVSLVTSNWTVKGKEVDFTPLPEAQFVAERNKDLYCRPYRDRPRTWDVLLLGLLKVFHLEK